MRIGLFGGTFDPIHVGHLIAAEEARERIRLEKIMFMPSGIPPHKQRQEISEASVRLEMTRIAVEENKYFEVSDFEVSREQASFTVETVRHFRQTLGNTVELFLIVGADSILEMSTWKEPQQILSECQPVVITRPGFDLSMLDRPLRERVLLIDGVLVSISSTDIRTRIAEGRSIRYLVPPRVASYIFEHGLYTDVSSTRRA